MSTATLPPIDEIYFDVITNIWQLVEDKYPLFEEREVDWHKMRRKYLNSVNNISSYEILYKHVDRMLAELKDPHTRMLSSPSFMNSFFPFLITNINDEFYFSIIFPELDTRLKVGMRIIAINGAPIETLLESIYARFRYKSESIRKSALINALLSGDFGETVEVTATNGAETINELLMSQGLGSLNGQNIEMRRKIAAKRMRPCLAKVYGDVGYIKILTFRQKEIVDNFLACIEECGKCSSLVIDLRSNSGGFVEQTKQIASLFMVDDKITGYRADKAGRCDTLLVKASPNKLPQFKKLIVLCDEHTASSSEYIFLSALKNADIRISVVGVRTAGLAHEATIFSLFDGSRVQVTTHKYFTPDGLVMDEIGIDPDIKIKNTIKFITEKKDDQLECALQLCRER